MSTSRYRAVVLTVAAFTLLVVPAVHPQETEEDRAVGVASRFFELTYDEKYDTLYDDYTAGAAKAEVSRQAFKQMMQALNAQIDEPPTDRRRDSVSLTTKRCIVKFSARIPGAGMKVTETATLVREEGGWKVLRFEVRPRQ